MTSLTPRFDRLEGFQNPIINGNFDFFQRGVGPLSISNAAVGRLADRFNFRPSATQGTGSMARSTSVPTLAESGFQSTYSLQVTAPASGGASIANTATSIDTRLEGYDYAPFHGQTVTCFFWVYSSVVGTYYAAFCNSDHSREYLAPFTISVANTWERKAVTLTLDTAGTWLFDNGIGLAIHWILQAGSSKQSGAVGSWFTKAADGAPIAGPGGVDFWATPSATFRVAQVMMARGSFTAEDGPVFQRAGKTVQQELAMCMRYYEKSSDTVNPINSGDYSTSTYTGASTREVVRLTVQKRANATITTRSDTTTTSGVSSLAYSVNSVNNFLDASVATNRNNFFVIALPSANATQYARFGWSADAEL